MLTEGQRDGLIEVLQINEKTAKVKVDNAGTVMEITFEKPSPAPPPAAPRPRQVLAAPVNAASSSLNTNLSLAVQVSFRYLCCDGRNSASHFEKPAAVERGEG